MLDYYIVSYVKLVKYVEKYLYLVTRKLRWPELFLHLKQKMESWADTIGLKGLVLIGIGACGLAAIWKIDSRDVFKKPEEQKCWKVVEFDELVEMIRSGSIQLFDVREREEVNSTSLIPTATNIPCMLVVLVFFCNHYFCRC